MTLFVNKAIFKNENQDSLLCKINNGRKISNFSSNLDSFSNKIDLNRSFNTAKFDITASDTYIAKSELYHQLINNIVSHADSKKSNNVNDTKITDENESQ